MPLNDVLDQRLSFPTNQVTSDVLSIAKIAIACLQTIPQSHPTMKQVSQDLSTWKPRLAKPLCMITLGEIVMSKLFSSVGSLNPSSSLLSMVKPKNPSLSRHSDRVESAFLGIILKSAWSVFLTGVETEEAGPLQWWSSERLGWVLGAVLWWVQIGCERGRGEESEVVVVEEDDDEEGSDVHVCVRGNEEAEPEVARRVDHDV
nr:hypothetical protein CFP56_71202 [Quercus suber]